MVQFTRLVATDVRADVSGSGSIFVTATKRLDASVSGSGATSTRASAERYQNITGSGAITGGHEKNGVDSMFRFSGPALPPS